MNTVEVRQRIAMWYDSKHDPVLSLIGWYDETMDARTCLDLQNVVPRKAAMLLCRINPLENEDPEGIYVDGDDSSPKRYRLLLQAFEDVASTSPKHRTLMEWRAIAQQKGLRYHTWIDEYEEAIGRLAPTEAPATSGTPEKGELSAMGAIISAGVTKAEILCIKWPLPDSAPPLENILDDLPKWVDAACNKTGRPGKGAGGSHLWNPALLAVCLATKTPQKKWAVGKGALTNFLRVNFSEYFEQWETVATDL